MRVLVDTPIWSLALRRDPARLNAEERDMVSALASLVTAYRVLLLGMVRQELLSGIREAAIFERLRVRLRSFDDVAVTTDEYEDAARIANLCRSRGIAGTPVDYLLCSVSLSRSAPVFSRDKDFERYRAIAGIRLYGDQGLE